MDYTIITDPPPDLHSGRGTFEPVEPGYYEPGGSFMAALHQAHQRLRPDLSAGPLEAVKLFLRRVNEDTKDAVLDDPVDYATALIAPPARQLLRVGPGRVPPARRLPRFAPGGSVAGALRRLVARAMPAFEEGAVTAPAPRGALSAVKPRGGQWLRGGDLDTALQGLYGGSYNMRDPTHPLKRSQQDPQFYVHPATGMQYRADEVERMQARNAWVDSQLRRYVERDMATPQDPLDELFLRGEGHITPEQLTGLGLDPRGGPGFPGNGLPFVAAEWAYTPDSLRYARGQYGPPRSAWGELADRAVQTGQTAGEIASKAWGGEPRGMNSWMAKADPSTPVYDIMGDEVPSLLGFDHVLDWLEASGIPPERWKNVSVPQAVQGTARLNAAAAKERQRDVAARLEASRRHLEARAPLKEYPEGYRWDEYRAENAPEDVAMGLSIDTCLMGHCVGGVGHNQHGYSGHVPMRDLVTGRKVHPSLPDTSGYYDDVMGGRGRILSLRDARTGQPEATVEVTQPFLDMALPYEQSRWLSDAELDELRKHATGPDSDPELSKDANIRRSARLLWPERFDVSKMAPRIAQIKGPGNATPRPEVLPYVQDLVKSMGPWSEVGDLQNTGLTRIKDKYVSLSDVKNLFNKHFKSGNPELALAYYNDMRRRDRAEMSDVDLGFLNAVDALAAGE